MNIVIRIDAINYGSTVPKTQVNCVFKGTYAQCVAYVKRSAYNMRKHGTIFSAECPEDTPSYRSVSYYSEFSRCKILTEWRVISNSMAIELELEGFILDLDIIYTYLLDRTHRKLEIFSSKDKAEKFLRKNKTYKRVTFKCDPLTAMTYWNRRIPVCFKYNFKDKVLEIGKESIEDGCLSIKFHK